MKILYFAWLREKTGIDREEVRLPSDVTDVQTLVSWLKGRGDGYADALNDLARIRVAVNQEAVPLDYPVGPDDEVAFFPPVTGG